MKLKDWLTCRVHAYKYFRGVTRLLSSDNFKIVVKKNTRYKTILNHCYKKLAEYYNTAIASARMEHLKDKHHAEVTIRLASTWILSAFRNEHFFTLAEAREAVRVKSEEMNPHPLTVNEGCRRTFYLYLYFDR